MFFVLETILSGLWWWFLARRFFLTSHPFPSAKGNLARHKTIVYLSSCSLTLLWLAFTYLFFFGAAKWTYLSIILFWALPPILLQLLFGADILWHHRKLVFWGILLPGIYCRVVWTTQVRPVFLQNNCVASCSNSIELLLPSNLPVEDSLRSGFCSLLIN